MHFHGDTTIALFYDFELLAHAQISKMENLPIDIHSNKLLDWLISRRHCTKDWQDKVNEVRKKIRHAIQDMPKDEKIVSILSGEQYFNYFHCKQILDILYETEKDSKNMLGFYSSQRVKDWKEIISCYEQQNIYLAEAANFLQRFVQFEVPTLRRTITKAENISKESERMQHDYAKQTAESRRAFERELTKWGLPIMANRQKSKQDDACLRRELLLLADAQPPTELPILMELTEALDYFQQFSLFIEQDTTDMFSLLRLLISNPNRPPTDVTVYEWRYGKKPESIVPFRVIESPSSQVVEESMEEEIDFGDDDYVADIDFCTNGDDTLNTDEIQILVSKNGKSDKSGIARGEESLPVLEHLPTCGIFLDELGQLISFLDFRLQDEMMENTAGIYLTGMFVQQPEEINNVGLEQIKNWLEIFRRTVINLSDPQRLQMLRIRTCQGFVDDIVFQLKHKRQLEYKYEKLEQMANERQQQCAKEIIHTQELLDHLIEKAKALQENLEEEISRRYNGREVYIMGEINAVLYGN